MDQYMPAIGKLQFIELDLHFPGRREVCIHGRKRTALLRDTFNLDDFPNNSAALRNHELIESVDRLCNLSMDRLSDFLDPNFLIERHFQWGPCRHRQREEIRPC